jgi:parallel beta-helix repeat protein
MKNYYRSISFILILITLWSFPLSAYAAATLKLEGTFHAIGVAVTISASDDPDQDAVATVIYRVQGDSTYHQGFPLSRVSSTRFVGSIFWLVPGTAYDVRVIFSDPDGLLQGNMVESTVSTRAEIVIPTPSRSFYVSPAGSGSVCSLGAPCTLINGVNQAQAGDEVVLRGGVYYQSKITLPRSGTAKAPIVIRSYPNETAILDGADPMIFSWKDQGGGVWSTTINVANTSLVTANGQRLYPYQSLADLQSLSWGIPGFYVNGTTLYAHLKNEANPNNVTMAISRQNSAFEIAQNFIYITDLTFRHYGGEGVPTIYLRNGSDNLIQNCTFTINDVGIAIKLNSHRNVIQNNQFVDTIFGWPWDAVKTNDLAAHLETASITFWDPNSGQGTMVAQGNIIRRNTFHDLFDGFGACPETDQGQGVTNETDVYENLVYNVVDDGMQTDGACSNVRIWSNTFHDGLTGISLAPVRVGPVYAICNLIYRTNNSAFKFEFDSPGYGPMYLFHNTAETAPGTSSLYITEPLTWPLLVSRNNVWVSNNSRVIDYNATGAPLDFDYDTLYRTSSGNLVGWNGTSYSTLTKFSTATGQERHGLNVAPGFANSTNGDYTLTASSSLIDKGEYISGINDRYIGKAPDIGAFEYTISGTNIEETKVKIYLPVIINNSR